MSDIQLTADTSQAVTELKKITAQVDSITSGFKKFAAESIASIDKVGASTASLNKTMDTFKSIISTAAISAFIHDIADLGQALTQASHASGVTADTINSFSESVGLAGGDAQKAVGDVIDFTASLKDAYDGSIQAQSELGRVGVTLKDLKTLSNEDIFKKTVQGLAMIENDALRTSLAVKMLGRNFKDIDVRDVASSMSAGVGQGSASAYQSFGDAGKNLKAIFHDIADEIVKAIKPIADFAKELKVSHDAIVEFVSFMKELLYWGVQIALFFSGGFIARGLGLVAEGIAAVLSKSEAILSFFSEFKVVGGAFEWAATKVRGFYDAFTKSTGTGATYNNLRNQIQELGPKTEEAFSKMVSASGKAKTELTATFERLNEKGKDLVMRMVEVGDVKKWFTSLSGAIGMAVSALANFWDTLWRMITGTDAAGKQLSEFEKIIHSVLSAIGKTIKLVFYDSFAFAFEYIGKFFDWLGDKLSAVMPFFQGIGHAIASAFTHEPTGAGDQTDAESNRLAAAEAAAKVAKETADFNREQRGLAAQLKVEHDAYLNGLKLQLERQQESIKLAMDHNQLIGEGASLRKAMSTDEVAVEQALYDLKQKQKDAQLQLNNEIAGGRAQLAGLLTDGSQKGEADKIGARIADLQQRLKEVNKEYEAQAEAITKITQAQQDQNKHNEIAQFGYTQARNNLTAMNDALYQMATMNMAPLDKQIADISETARKAAEAQVALMTANGTTMSESDIQQVYKEAYRGVAELIKATKDLNKEQRTFESGWTQAFNAYADNATNAAKMAGDAFNAVTNSMNNAIDTFVTTGKFSFRDMATSIIQDLLKIELKAQAMNLWKAAGGGSGIISTIGGLLGFANGGEPPVNKPSIVGENGPELFVPKTAGTIIPNSAFSSGRGFDMSGTARMMSAPTPPSSTRVTNNTTQNTYVTNSISALDAQSVSQLLMSNKNTIFGIVKQAQKGIA